MQIICEKHWAYQVKIKGLSGPYRCLWQVNLGNPICSFDVNPYGTWQDPVVWLVRVL